MVNEVYKIRNVPVTILIYEYVSPPSPAKFVDYIPTQGRFNDKTK